MSNPSLQGTRGSAKRLLMCCRSGFLTISDEIFTTKRKGPSTFAEEQARFAAEQIDLLTNLGESLLESLQGVYSLHSTIVWLVTAAPSFGRFKLVLLDACQMG